MANQKFNISFVIGAVDNVSLKVMQINERVQKAFAPFQKAGQAFGFLGAELGINKIGAALGNVGQKGKAVFDGFVSAGLRLAAVAGAVAAGFKYVAGGAAQTADEIRDASDRIGISTGLFQTLQYASTQSGVSLRKLEPLLTKFSQVVGEASEGTNDAAKIFATLGVSLKGPDGMLRSMDEILPSLADRLSKIENPAIRNAVAVKLFGKEGVKFTQVLAGGAKGLEDFKARAEELGIVLGEDMISDGARLNDQMEEVGLVFTRLRDAVGAELFPVLKDLLTQLTQIFVDNRPAIIQFAKAFAQDLPGILKSLVDVFKGLALVVGPIIFIFEGLAKVFGTANLIFGTVAAVISTKLILAIYALMGALVKLGLIAAATPIGWIAIGIGLVIAAIVALIAYREPIVNFFKGIWEWMSPVVDLFVKFAAGIPGVLGVLGSLGKVFGLGGAAQAGGATGPALGATQTALEAQTAGGGISKTENKISVDFNNLPPGTRIKTEKAEAPVDLTMGYGMVTQ